MNYRISLFALLVIVLLTDVSVLVAEKITFKLAVEWIPEFCKNSRIPCKPGVVVNMFTTHGLWRFPTVAKKDDRDAEGEIRKRLNDLKVYWPNLLPGPENAFWLHEWLAHGRYSGLRAKEYFRLSLEVTKLQNVTKILNDNFIIPDMNTKYSADQIKTAIRNKIGFDPVIVCSRQGSFYDMKEIYICVEEDTADIIVIPDYIACGSSTTTCGYSTTGANIRLLPAPPPPPSPPLAAENLVWATN